MPATVTITVQTRLNASTFYHLEVRSQVGCKEVRGKTVSDFESLFSRIQLSDTPGLPPIPPLPPKKPPGDKKTRHETIRKGLEMFVNTMLATPHRAGNSALCTFIGIPPEAAMHGFEQPSPEMPQVQQQADAASPPPQQQAAPRQAAASPPPPVEEALYGSADVRALFGDDPGSPMIGSQAPTPAAPPSGGPGPVPPLPDDAARRWLEQSGGIPPEYANLRAQAEELKQKDVERRAAARQAAIERGEIDP